MVKVLSMEEVKKLCFNTQQWMEFHMRKRNGEILNTCCQQYFLKGHMAKDRMPGYNSWWRVWDSKPTPAKWNKQGGD